MNDLILELLAWIAKQPRTYADTMAAWRTSCPRSPVWEDVTAAGLVEIVTNGRGIDASPVTLTAAGRAVLEEATTHR